MYNSVKSQDICQLNVKFQCHFAGMVSDNIRGWMDFIDETELVIMANADLIFDHPKPLFPNVISVEGLTVKEGRSLSRGRSNIIYVQESPLRECKRRTARCISCLWWGYPGPDWGTPPSSTWDQRAGYPCSPPQVKRQTS